MRPKIEFTDEDIKKVEELAASLTKQQIADYFGICFNTFQRLVTEDDRVTEAYRRGKAKAVIDVAGSVLSEARTGNMQAAIFYLKTQAGWKETDRKEISGIDGAPIETDSKWTIEIVGASDAAEAGQ
jgi:hypothetical protein